ncbi:MAG: transcriptional regulator [Oceanospirillaceae bacterium]|nr:transcriptional regulator [Oceanospirillaceae bacterium]MBL36676.1 transcriptional regulator [Oceanospirillaceae bacterium]MBS54460.1 transcriptional regulator [Oceanospirillaceae bacterium]|tara:strand:+ start:219 stop:608 length:390 start_codon:yes stop_codon:yes gene_type:complete
MKITFLRGKFISSDAPGGRMKLIQAVIRPSALNTLRAALTAMGIGGLSIADSAACEWTPGDEQPGVIHHDVFQPNMRIELAVVDGDLERAIEAISDAVRGEKLQDGKIFVVNLAQARRIRTGETDDKAI